MVLSLDIINDLLFTGIKIAIMAYSVMAVVATSHDSSAACRHRMLLFGLAACIALPLLSHSLPAIALPIVPALAAQTAQIEFSSLASITRQPVIAPLIGVYVLLSLWFFSKLISGLWQLRALGQRATIIPVESLSDTCRQPLAVVRPVKLLAAHDLHTPMIWGWLRPKLALPQSYREWNEPRLRHVLLHELAHLRRGDWTITLFAHAVVCLLWPLACIWTLRKQLLWYAEVACDDQVLSAGVSRPDYAASLLSFTHTRPVGFPGNSLIDPSQVFRRIHTVLDGARTVQSSQRPPLALAGIGLMLLLPVSALQLTPREPATDAAIHLLPLQITRPEQPAHRPPPVDSTDVDWQTLKSNLLADAPPAPGKPQHRWRVDSHPLPMEASTRQPLWQPRQVPLDAPLHNTVRVLPIYPKRALQRGREGHVTVEFDITARGTVVNEKVVEAVPPGVFDDAALEALRQYRYSPGHDNAQGTIVQRRREIFRFNLNEDAKLTSGQ